MRRLLLLDSMPSIAVECGNVNSLGVILLGVSFIIYLMQMKSAHDAVPSMDALHLWQAEVWLQSCLTSAAAGLCPTSQTTTRSLVHLQIGARSSDPTPPSEVAQRRERLKEW